METPASVNILDYNPYANRGLVDAAPAMQQAIFDVTSGTSKSGYSIFCPPGIYLWETPVLVVNGFTLLGSGIGNTIFQSAPGFNNWMFIFCPEATPFTPFINPPQYQSRNAMGRMNMSATKLYNAMGRMNVSAPSAGITVNMSDITLDGNCTRQTAGGCIYAAGSVQSVFDHLQFLAPYDAGLVFDQISPGFYGTMNRILNCFFLNGSLSAGNGQGMRIQTNQPQFVEMCDFNSCGGAGTEPYAIKDMYGFNIFNNCNFYHGGEGIHIMPGANLDRIIGCFFNDVGQHAIYSLSSTMSIVGNLFLRGSSAGAGSYSSIVADAAFGMSIVGNSFVSPAANGQLRSFFREINGSDYNTFSDNRIFVDGTLGTGLIEHLGNHSVSSHNPGFNPRGFLSQAVTASGTTISNPFGVDCMVIITGGTVSDISMGGVSTGLTAGTLRIPAGQTIRLTYTVAPTWKWFGD